jgi:hypothetical protein
MATNIGRLAQAFLDPVVVGLNSVEVTASQVISGSPGFLAGVFVASASAATIKLWDNPLAGSGAVLVNTFTPALGWNPCPIPFSTGLFATVGGTLDATFVYS